MVILPKGRGTPLMLRASGAPTLSAGKIEFNTNYNFNTSQDSKFDSKSAICFILIATLTASAPPFPLRWEAHMRSAHAHSPMGP